MQLGAKRRRLAIAGALCVVAAVASSSASTAEQRAAAVSLTLQTPDAAKCKAAGGEVIGKACADKRGMILHTKWQVGDGNASWNTDQWQTTYAWTVPSTIPQGGANVTLRMGATELTRNPNARICPAMSIRGGFDMKVGGATQGQPVGLGFCADSGGSKSDTKTIKLVPSPATPPGTTLVLQLGIQDGPGYTYTYKADAPKCRKPAAVGQISRCRYRVNWIFTQGGRRPAGMPSWVTDVATAGTGSAVYGEQFGKKDVESEKAKVVRTMEIARRDPDTGLAIEDVRLVFREDESGEGEYEARAVLVPLRLVTSSDPLCPAPKEAFVGALEGTKGKVDMMRLQVSGCPHHNGVFRGSIGPKSAVNVAVVEKPA